MALGMEVGLGPDHIVLDEDWMPLLSPSHSVKAPTEMLLTSRMK